MGRGLKTSRNSVRWHRIKVCLATGMWLLGLLYSETVAGGIGSTQLARESFEGTVGEIGFSVVGEFTSGANFVTSQ